MELEKTLERVAAEIRAAAESHIAARVRAEREARMNEEAAQLGRRYIKIRAVCEKLNISESTLHRLRHSSRGFPKPCCGVDGVPRWSINELEAWMESHRAPY